MKTADVIRVLSIASLGPSKEKRDQAPDPRTLPPVDPPPIQDDGRGSSVPVRRFG